MGPPIRQEAEPRRHHYVPQCWLAGFTETGENDGRLWVTDFSRQQQWPTTPANAGHIRDFYRLADPAPDPVAVERFFSQLEGIYSSFSWNSAAATPFSITRAQTDFCHSTRLTRVFVYSSAQAAPVGLSWMYMKMGQPTPSAFALAMP